MEVPLIPRELLFGNPDRVSPETSPDGRRLGWLAPLDGVMNIWVRGPGEPERPLTNERGRGIGQFAFAEDGRHVVFLKDRDGDENWHVHTIPFEGGEAVDLTPIDGIQARLFGFSPRRPREILVGLNDRDPELHDVWRVDLATGERTLVLRNDLGAVDFLADHDLVVRAAQIPTADGGFTVLHRPDEATEFQEILAFTADDAMGGGLFGFADDDRTLYFHGSDGANASELRAIDVQTGQITVLAGDPEADVADVLLHPATFAAQAAVFLKQKQEIRPLDPAIAADLARAAAVHYGELAVLSRDREDRTWLLAHVQDRGPVVYHLFDRASGRAEFLFSSRPQLAETVLAEMRPVSYRARDGLTIHGYLTLPPESEGRNLPLVLLVHGGPWHRDVWGYNPLPQWLANRGYACLMPNFRGSTGYGKAFVNAGDREWGGKMQDDLTDGVRWLVEEGVADPARVAIFGGSYGGYAVLSGLTTTPELYRCGVDLVGPSNLLTFARSIPPYWEPLRALFTRRVGDVDREPEFLRERSPLFKIDRILAPLLIGQGANDPRVKREESLQIVQALRAAGKEVEYLEYPDEGHGFMRPENRLSFFAAAEQFLARHLGGRAEP